MNRSFLVLAAAFLAVLALPTRSFAQTAKWTTTDTVAAATSDTYTLKVGTTVLPTGTVSCTVVNSVTTCTLPITAPLPLPAGSYTLTATNVFGSTVSDPFVGGAPAKPSSLIISVP